MNALTRRLNTLAILGLATIATHAQDDPLVTTATAIQNEFLTLAPYLVAIGIIIGGLSIMFGHSEGWSRLGKVIIGGCLIMGAVALVTKLVGTGGGAH